jgi:NADH-quinone oxidoreductase subunit L
MGGLRKFMPTTFATYAIGMLALSGFPLFFSGFWSKDEILHSAHKWSVSHWPFYLGVFGALLTAFYMTRQVAMVFFGNCRLNPGRTTGSEPHTAEHAGDPDKEHPQVELAGDPHESRRVMTVPLIILAVFAIILGFIGTPAWPWFQHFLHEHSAGVNDAGGSALRQAQFAFDFAKLGESGVFSTMLISTAVVFLGIGIGWWLYGRKPITKVNEADVLERAQPDVYHLLKRKYFVDEIYEWSFVQLNAWWAKACAWLDAVIVSGAVQLCSYIVLGLSAVNRAIDDLVINLGFDQGCRGVGLGGKLMSRLQNGRVQNYLRVIGIALAVLVLFLIWGCHS